jgi:hypothetical protein
MANEPVTRFQELTATVFDVLKALETEVIAYRAAAASLKTSVFDGGLADIAFQRALTSARHAPSTRKAADKYAVELARFAELSHLPDGPNMGLLHEWLLLFRQGDPRLFPSGDAPLKDAL